MNMPRPEYPRPQFVRKDWLCLNGEWEFEIDHGDSGSERGLRTTPLKGRITVPFCPESSLSGIGNVDFMQAVWYRREVTIPKEWAGRDVLLHFGGVDYEAFIWVNDKEVGRHRGGSTPITCNLAGVASPGEKITIVVRARDHKGEAKPGGKQQTQYRNAGCHYTRTTGIWQTVWMEPVPKVHLRRARITPDLANRRFRVNQPISNNPTGWRVRAIVKDDRGEVARAEVPADKDFAPELDLVIPENRMRLWNVGEPNLYDIDIALLDAAGKVVDTVAAYAGMRSITIEGQAVKINGKPVFQRLVLDQGFYPDGIWTAPTDEALKRDITLSMEIGFNGARLHQKVFEERFLYHADKLGYIVWGEFPDWGIDRGTTRATYITQWLEEIERDYSHPSIVGWCALNETHEGLWDSVSSLDDLIRGMYYAAKAMDTSRPVLDSSGYSHRVPELDIYDSHDYEQDPAKFFENHKGTADGKPFINGDPRTPISVPYRGQPYFCSEIGGIWWNPEVKEGQDSWGYGGRPKTIEEFNVRFEGLCNVMLDNPAIFGYCYTQLTDVYQEQNGVYFFDRRPKFDVKRLHKIQTKKAAIES